MQPEAIINPAGWMQRAAGFWREAGRRLVPRKASRAAAGRRAGDVVLVGAGPGNPELLTLAAVRALAEADVVLHDALVTPEILAYARPGAALVAVGKRGGCPSARQDDINALLAAEAMKGHRVVRLKGGDPFIFGRGGEEMAYLRACGIAVRIVPGVTAAFAAAAELGVPLTHRGTARRLMLATATCSSEEESDRLDWQAAACPDVTLALYMGRARLEATAKRLIAAGRDPYTPCLAVENVGRPERRQISAPLVSLARHVAVWGDDGPLVVLIGEVTAMADAELSVALAVAQG